MAAVTPTLSAIGLEELNGSDSESERHTWGEERPNTGCTRPR